jgi:two-component system, NarL family, response regulator LiaR
MIKVLICDDQEVVCKGLNIILSHSKGIEVVGLAENGEVGCRMALELKPDVVLMDLKMPLLNGIHATRRISTALPDTRIVVLTTYDGDDWVFDAVRAGACGYLLKDAAGEEIVTAVRDAAAGKTHLDPAIAGKILSEFNRLQQTLLPAKTNQALRQSLTGRELSILQLMAEGKNNQEIADELYLAVGTVKNNVSNILGKLQANDRTQAVVSALREGIVDLDQTT